MAVENLTATIRAPRGFREMVADTGTVEVTAGASVGSTYTMVELSTSDRLEGWSHVAWDALSASGTTIDIGFLRKNQSGVTDDDALLADIDVTAQSAQALSLIGDPANFGKPVWEIMGLQEDPNTKVCISATIKDATASAGGTITVVAVYTQV